MVREEPVAHRVGLRRGEEAVGRRPALHPVARHPPVAAQRDRVDQRRRPHARDRPEPLQRLLAERRDHRVVAVLRHRQPELGGDQVVRVEADRHLLQPAEAPRQEPRAHQQHDAEAELDRHEELAHPGPAEEVGPAPLQRVGQLAPGAVPRRDRAEDEPGADRDREREEQHPPVEPHLAERRQSVRHHRHQRRDPPARDQHAHRPADQRQHHALGQELADQSRPPGAECRAERHLPPAGGGAGELEVGDVGAGDAQDQRHEPQQDQQRRPDLADQRIAERLEADPQPGVGRGELGGELRRDAGQVRRRVRGGHPRAHPSHRPERRAFPGEPGRVGRRGHRQPHLGRAERVLVLGAESRRSPAAGRRSAPASGPPGPSRRRSARSRSRATGPPPAPPFPPSSPRR